MFAKIFESLFLSIVLVVCANIVIDSKLGIDDPSMNDFITAIIFIFLVIITNVMGIICIWCGGKKK